MLPGQEVRLYGNLLEEYESGKVMTLNETNKYMLIEFPANHVPHYAEQLLYELKLKGLLQLLLILNATLSLERDQISYMIL